MYIIGNYCTCTPGQFRKIISPVPRAIPTPCATLNCPGPESITILKTSKILTGLKFWLLFPLMYWPQRCHLASGLGMG